MKLRWLVSAGLGLAMAVLPPGAGLAQPSSDDLAAAALVTGLPFTDSVDTSDATMEAGEPAVPCAPLHATVWYALTLDAATLVGIDTAGSSYDTVLGVYQGTSYADLDLVDCNDDDQDLQASLTFPAAAGETYLVQVGSFGEAEFGSGGGQLEISFSRGSRRPDVIKDSFRGSQAVAEWFSVQENSFSDTVAVLSDHRIGSGPGKPVAESVLDVFHFSEHFDPVTGAVTIVDLVGLAPLQADQFSIDRQLRNASVDAELTLGGIQCTFSDEVEECEPIVMEVDVSIIWQGVGGITRNRLLERQHGDDFRFTFRTQASVREASTDGGITGEMDLTSGPADFALVVRATESVLVWSRSG